MHSAYYFDIITRREHLGEGEQREREGEGEGE
jgi:hypothetical protein